MDSRVEFCDVFGVRPLKPAAHPRHRFRARHREPSRTKAGEIEFDPTGDAEKSVSDADASCGELVDDEDRHVIEAKISAP